MNSLARIILITSIFPINLWAQFEETPPSFPESGYEEQPAPPQGSGDTDAGDDYGSGFANENPSSGVNSQNSKGLAKDSDKRGVLSPEQKEKFSRADTSGISDSDFPETIESFDFPNVDITDVVKAISELTGKNFIIDPGVKGKITIIAPSKITVAEAYRAFLSALAIHHYTIVPSGGFLKIKRARDAQKDSIETYSGAYYPDTDQIITRIVHLKYISAELVQKELVRFLHTADGDMAIYTATNSLIISDYGSNIDRIMRILNQLDVPGFEEKLQVIQVRYAKAKDLADLIDRIVNKGQSSQSRGGSTFGSGVPRFSRSSTNAQQGAMYFMAIPDDRTNSIIAVGNKAGIDRVKALIKQLDFRIKPEENGGIFVYYVKNGDAEKIAQTLSGVTKEATAKSSTGGPGLPGGAPGGAPNSMAAATEIFGGDVKIAADKNTNSLVITASRSDYDMVMRLLEKLDIPRDQVFVEAYILEMNANDGVNWGVGYYQYSESGYGKSGFNSGLDLNSLLSPVGGQGAVIGFGRGNTVKVTDPISKSQIEIPNLIGFINFLKNVKKANILSTPQILALDNEESYIDVGNKVATKVTETATATGTSRSVDLEDATIKLTIKPFISPASESIRMELKQEVKQIAQVTLPKNLQDNSQPLAKREIKTNVVVNNGDTVVLGGLIQEQEREVVSKVPFLGDIPVLGWLFKSKELLKEKVNMLTLLSPRIVRNPAHQNQILSEKTQERVDFVKDMGGHDPFGAKIDRLTKRGPLSGVGSTPSAKVNIENKPIEKAQEASMGESPSEEETMDTRDNSQPSLDL